MNKAQLIETVCGTMGTSRAAAQRAVAAVFDGIRHGLKKSRSVQIVGFGTFTVRTRKARKGRNPQTGAAITIKASRTVGFKASKTLRSGL